MTTEEKALLIAELLDNAMVETHWHGASEDVIAALYGEITEQLANCAPSVRDEDGNWYRSMLNPGAQWQRSRL